MRLKKEDEFIFNEKLDQALAYYQQLVARGIKPNTNDIIHKFNLTRSGEFITFKGFYKILKRRQIFTYNQYTKKRNSDICKLIDQSVDLMLIATKYDLDVYRIKKIYSNNNPQSGGVIEQKGILKLVVQRYQDGKTLDDIGLEFNVSSDQVSRALKFVGIPLRKRYEIGFKHKNIINDYFSKIDSKKKAWVLGFVFADGSISSNELAISQDQSHNYILMKIAENIGHEGNFTTAKKSHTPNLQSVLTISRHIIVEDLRRLGLTNDKENDLSFPFDSLDEQYYLAFIAGFFVGDGSIVMNRNEPITYDPIYKGLPVLQFTSTQEMCINLKTILEKKLPGVELHVHPEKRKNAYYVNTQKFINLMTIATALSQEGLGIFHSKKFYRLARCCEIYRYRYSIRYLRSNHNDEANLLADLITKRKWPLRQEKTHLNLLKIANRQIFVNSPFLNKLFSDFSITYKDAINFQSLEDRGIIPKNIWRRTSITPESMLEPYLDKDEFSELFYT